MSEKDIHSLEHTKYRCQYHSSVCPEICSGRCDGIPEGKEQSDDI